MPMLTVRKMPTYRGIFEGGVALRTRGVRVYTSVCETARWWRPLGGGSPASLPDL